MTLINDSEQHVGRIPVIRRKRISILPLGW